MKKIALILIVAAMSLSLFGCCASNTDAQKTEESSAVSESKNTATAKPTEKRTEKQTEKQSEQQTEKNTETQTKAPADANQNNTQENSKTPEETAEQTQTLNPDDYIGIYDSDIIAYEDDLGNIYNAEYTVPKLKINSGDADRVNNEISDKCLVRLRESREARDGRYSLSCTGISYSSCFYGDILTLLISTTYDTGYTDYLVYSLDVSSGSLMNNEQIAQSVSMDYGSLKGKIRQIMLDYYDNEYSSMKDEYASLYDEYRNNTGSDENVNNAELYINEGVLCMHCYIYSLAGADMYQVILPII